MAARSFTIAELEGAKGQTIGSSDWHEVPQQAIQLFADATHDQQWIHTDPERAKAESPFGGPIAHGFYTLSLAPYLLDQIVHVTGVRMGVNYGLNKVRFTGPVRIGKRVRLTAGIEEFEVVAGGNGAQVTVGLTFEVEGEAKPACVAQWICRYYS